MSFLFDPLLPSANLLSGDSSQPETGNIKVWTGAAWTSKRVLRWNGSSWIKANVKYWNGSSWTITNY
jgi:hypothetical protein